MKPVNAPSRLRDMLAHLGQAAVVACLLLEMACPAVAQVKPFAINSIAFPLVGSNYLDDHPGWTSVQDVIKELKALGANDVKLTVSAGSYDTPTANSANPSVSLNPSEEKMLSFMQQLKAAGLQVTVLPFVNINFDPNGNLLDTVHAQPTNFTAWIGGHTAAMVRLARLAQRAGADRFSVFADEVQPLTWNAANTQGWLDMIAQVRAVFTGQLTSAIWANGAILAGGNTHIDLTARPLIDALDIIGIGWFPNPLTNFNQPTLAELISSWRKTVSGVDTVAFLQGLHARYGKPIWISDIAFHSFAGDNVRSNNIYNMAISLVADEQGQANEYDSLFSVLSRAMGPWFLGVSCDSWNRFPANFTETARFFSSPYGENIKGKPAEGVVRGWFTGHRGWGGMQVSANAARSDNSLTLSAELAVSSIDEARDGRLYVAALLPNGATLMLSARGWTVYAGGALPHYGAVTLGRHHIPILSAPTDVTGLAGTSVVVGYGLDENDMLANRKFLVVYTVE